MKGTISINSFIAAALLTFSVGDLAAASLGTAFTYQGRLAEGTNGANGNYDLIFGLYESDTSVNSLTSPLTNRLVVVRNGLFMTTLDFGAGMLNSTNAWLEISVRTNGSGAFTTLAPRQNLTPVPSSVRAAYADALSGVLPTLGLAGTYSNFLTFNNPANNFTGNGSGLTAVNANTLGGMASDNFWQLGGNAGSVAGVNFVGTADDRPLEFKVNGQRALRLEPNPSGAPNVIAGAADNYVTSGSYAPQGSGGLTIGGGTSNRISSVWDTCLLNTIGGGGTNIIHQGNAGPYAHTIGGGMRNTIRADYACAIGGGADNSIGFDNFGATIGGGLSNAIDGNGATIAGGSDNVIRDWLPGEGYGAIGGGSGNSIGYASLYGWIGGGSNSTILGLSKYTSIGGGASNTNGGWYATLSGGRENLLDADYGVIGGGYLNFIQDNGFSAVAGGFSNSVSGLSGYAMIGGGSGNSISNALYATVSGGLSNSVYGDFSTIPGGQNNFATKYAFAAGYRAKAIHQGAFVWASGNTRDYPSDTDNSFNIYAAGGVQIEYGGQDPDGTGLKWLVLASRTPGRVINVSNGAYLSEGGSWVDVCDRNAKKDFEAVNGREVLERVAKLPLSTWSYRSGTEPARHLGPVAQDFHAAFGLGADDKHIAALDSSGVALAAIQGLNQKLEETVKAQDNEIKELKQTVDELRMQVNALVQKSHEGDQ